jgi:hypothetical protein
MGGTVDILIRTNSNGEHVVQTRKDSFTAITFDRAKEIYRMEVEEV